MPPLAPACCPCFLISYTYKVQRPSLKANRATVACNMLLSTVVLLQGHGVPVQVLHCVAFCGRNHVPLLNIKVIQQP